MRRNLNQFVGKISNKIKRCSDVHNIRNNLSPQSNQSIHLETFGNDKEINNLSSTYNVNVLKNKSTTNMKTLLLKNSVPITSVSVQNNKRSFSTSSLLVMQNNDTTSKTQDDGFTNMMNTLFVKFKDPDLKELNNHIENYYDLDSEETYDPKSDPSNKTLTENGATAFSKTGSGLVDFFYFSVRGVSQTKIHTLLNSSWEEEPLKTLKLIFFIRDIRKGKGEKEIFYETQRWLALHHPQTFLENLKHFPKSGYWKDLQNVLLYIKYGGHEVDERPNIKSTELQSILLKRLPSRKALYEREVHKLRSTNELESFRYSEEDFATIWQQQIKDEDKLVLNTNQNKKLKMVYEKAKSLVVDLYAEQLLIDKDLFESGKPISLCAKWAPTINLSADRDLGIGRKIAQKLFPYEKPGGIYLTKRKEGKGNKNFTDLQVYRYLSNIKYQKLLRDLRKGTNTIETFMSAKDWSNIPYEKVPSVCMKRNKELFEKRDKSRFEAYLDNVKKGETTINGKDLFPHELTRELLGKENAMTDTIELQWKEIVKNVKQQSQNALFNCIPVCDVSGSMTGTPLEVATALSLLMSELNTGIFKDKIITFSQKPTFINLEGVDSLQERLEILEHSHWEMNTNYLAVFELILNHALKNNLPKDQMISKVVVFSDMQFDCSQERVEKTPHEQLVDLYAQHGYEAPNIIYWNLNGNFYNTPVTVNTDGVAIISGFNSTLLRMVNEGFDSNTLLKCCVEDYNFVTLHD